ncbi:unnamed protein product [Adineta ricciae]|uniref:Protein quiver n=1 Tax=Adineta ricciae TaxID=249248 RepID=A0A815IWN2_ADIRI|nr:unnamed protein product [Adineta ricciae]
MKNHLFVLISLMSSIVVINGYQCYSCQLSDNCNDPFNSKGITIVNATENERCWKSKISGTVVRSVIAVDVCKQGENSCIDTSSIGVDAATCCCNSDLCNNVRSLRYDSIMLILFLTISFIYYSC